MGRPSRSPIATIVVWVLYASNVLTLPAEYGYVGVILITAFTYTLLRLRFVLVVLITVVGIAAYLPYAYTARYIVDVSRVLATLYLVSFGALGRSGRLPDGTVHAAAVRPRTPARSGAAAIRRPPVEHPAAGRHRAAEGLVRRAVAQAFDEVSVVFVDAVGSTEQAARSSPAEFAAALDALFRRFDEIADRHGLEKIKTIGDAYMAVAGAPVPAPDHAGAAVAMALDILADSQTVRWPSGDPIMVRGGVATGPAVAGVIGSGSSRTTCGATR